MINAYLVPIVYSYAKGTDKLNCSFSTAENTHLLRKVKYHNMADILLYMFFLFFVFLNGPSPATFFVNFRSFSNKHQYNFTTN